MIVHSYRGYRIVVGDAARNPEHDRLERYCFVRDTDGREITRQDMDASLPLDAVIEAAIRVINKHASAA